MITPKSKTAWKSKSAAVGVVAAVFALAVLAARTGAQDAARAPRPEMADDKRWQTVAPGQVEPSSGAIKMAAPVMDVIAQVLVKANDKVFAGEPLIRLTDNEARARRCPRLSGSPSRNGPRITNAVLRSCVGPFR